METQNERIPDPKKIEKELSEFLAKKFGGEVKVLSPVQVQRDVAIDKPQAVKEKKRIHFDLKPQDLIAYLDQYMIRQDSAKAILSTKICTHFNRIQYAEAHPDEADRMVGRIKNNVLMIGPTGVGKTYMIRLIAKKIGVPFVKGDATKFSETGYVGGDVDDLIRDLVREADDDIELAEYGIIYIDEIDKIASSRNMIGADVSRTGVQRALLKPMEETDVELKVPHDPISMIQEIERYRSSGKRDKRVVNTRNILFIMSGAFSDLHEIITRRLTTQSMGFGARLKGEQTREEVLAQTTSEDLVKFGFESEFVGRLPVQAVLERLTEDDLYEILRNPNNPVILGKKIDFAAYGIRIQFSDDALRYLAQGAFRENTGARGLVSAIERALLPFEKRLPSTQVRLFPVTEHALTHPEETVQHLTESDEDSLQEAYDEILRREKKQVKSFIIAQKRTLTDKHNIRLTPERIDTVTDYYCDHTRDLESVLAQIKRLTDEIKKMELFFFKNHDINIVLEDDAIDFLIHQIIHEGRNADDCFKQLNLDFEYGLKLVREKTEKNRFFISREALMNPETYIGNLLKSNELTS